MRVLLVALVVLIAGCATPAPEVPLAERGMAPAPTGGTPPDTPSKAAGNDPTTADDPADSPDDSPDDSAPAPSDEPVADDPADTAEHAAPAPTRTRAVHELHLYPDTPVVKAYTWGGHCLYFDDAVDVLRGNVTVTFEATPNLQELDLILSAVDAWASTGPMPGPIILDLGEFEGPFRLAVRPDWSRGDVPLDHVVTLSIDLTHEGAMAEPRSSQCREP